jgi:DNA-binding transcriptional regulator/RsmH inhibitor MraZ
MIVQAKFHRVIDQFLDQLSEAAIFPRYCLNIHIYSQSPTCQDIQELLSVPRITEKFSGLIFFKRKIRKFTEHCSASAHDATIDQKNRPVIPMHSRDSQAIRLKSRIRQLMKMLFLKSPHSHC